MKTATVRLVESKVNSVSPPSLGRGVVTAVHPTGVTVVLPDGAEVTAELALALPYAACEGDVLLILGDGAECFVVGVLSGRGKTSLELQGNVSLRAVGGALDLSGDEGVCVHGPAVEVRSDKLHMVARSVVETFSSLFQRVTDVLNVHSRQEVSVVDEGSYRQAKTASLQTEGTVTINGKEILLG
jgi:hypothetical protein